MKYIIPTLTLSIALSATSIAHDDPSHDSNPKAVNTEIVKTGNGKFTYWANSAWGVLKKGEKIGPTHGGVVIDETGLIYVSTDGVQAIFVFRADGTLVKTMPKELRGIHQLTINKEQNQEFIYGAQLAGNRIVKLSLDGEVVLEIPNTKTDDIPDGFKGVTGVTVAPDGSIFVAVGYGSNLIHKFDAEGNLIKSFGGTGHTPDQFITCHNVSIDTRFNEPRLLVVDRERLRLAHFDLDGNYIGDYANNLRRPCAVSFHGEYCAVAELQGRVTILDKQGVPIAFLGDNPDKSKWANSKVKPEEQRAGLFSAPHGLSFDKDGNLYVQDWNATGRVTQLLKVNP